MKNSKLKRTDFLSYWKESLQKKFNSYESNEIKIGLEVEFFLMNEKNEPACLDLSQLFFNELKNIIKNDFKEIRIEHEIISGVKSITSLKPQFIDNSWITISYEYSPHLLEISFSAHKSLDSLSKEVNLIFSYITKASIKSNTLINFEHQLNKENIEKIKKQINKKQFKLQKNREAILSTSPTEEDKILASFPSYTASTHIHISGHDWLNDSFFINRLYQIEPSIMLETGYTELKDKWNSYLKLFTNFSLVGFPNYKSWTIENWINDLHQEFIDNEYETIDKVRDLQSIRPRLFGTIEFRSDSALHNIQEILKITAFRLGQYMLAQDTSFCADLASYANSRKIWLTQLNNGIYKNEKIRKIVFNKISFLLKSRGFEEEKYLRQNNEPSC